MTVGVLIVQAPQRDATYDRPKQFWLAPRHEVGRNTFLEADASPRTLRCTLDARSIRVRPLAFSSPSRLCIASACGSNAISVVARSRKTRVYRSTSTQDFHADSLAVRVLRGEPLYSRGAVLDHWYEFQPITEPLRAKPCRGPRIKRVAGKISFALSHSHTPVLILPSYLFRATRGPKFLHMERITGSRCTAGTATTAVR